VSDPHDTQVFDFDLYKNEHWKGGSRDAELAEFERQIDDVMKAQRDLQRQRGASEGDRVFHQKQNGCLVGKLNILDDRPRDAGRATYVGMFSGEKKQYTVLARFSNGVGKEQPDIIPDVRGIGIKIFGVHDDLTGREKNIDFTMTNSPTPFGRDQEEFVEFMKAKINPGPAGIHLLGYLAKHPQVARRLGAASFRYVSSVTQLRYWAGHAYLLGPHRAMKLNLRPEKSERVSRDYPVSGISLSDRLDMLVKDDWSGFQSFFKPFDRDYLKKELKARAASEPVRFILSVQLEKDTISTPIENNLKEWKESVSPSIPVAELVFNPQDIDNPELESVCHQARFSPGHFVSQHRPLSNMGRGRMVVYRASQMGRGAEPQDLDEETITHLMKR
jgi:hypothetical protein